MAKERGAKDKQAPAKAAFVLGVSPGERLRMIAEAAYFRAQARSFQGGDPLEDWLAAEAEIDRALCGPQQQKEEQAAYEQLRAEVLKGFAAMRDSIDARGIQEAIERAAAQVRRTGDHALETVNRVAEAMKKDLAGTATLLGPQWESFSDKSAEMFSVWRDRSSVFLARAAVAMGDWLNQAGRRWERPQYRAGEMVGSGGFACTQCGELQRLETSAHLASCRNCQGSEFRRIE